MRQHKDYSLDNCYRPRSTFFWGKGFHDGDTIDIVFQEKENGSRAAAAPAVAAQKIMQFFLISGFDGEDAHKERISRFACVEHAINTKQ
jgi:hypothetical protein